MAKHRRAESGAGSVYARRDRPGTWVAEVEVNGKRHRSYFPNEKAARLGLDKLRAEAGAVTREEQENLRAWLTHWADVVVPRQVDRRRLEPKTALYYQGVVRNQWLRSPLANEPLSAIGPAQIEAALEDMIASLSRTTVSHARAVLSAAYNAAVREAARQAIQSHQPSFATSPAGQCQIEPGSFPCRATWHVRSAMRSRIHLIGRLSS